MAVDATTLWKTAATRGDVFVDCWGPGAVGKPQYWAAWFLFDGGDDSVLLTLMDEAAQLSAQVLSVEQLDILGPQGEVVGFQCFLTGDGKGMQAANWQAGKKCWVCPHNTTGPLTPEDPPQLGVRCGAFLWPIPVARRVGDVTHATARIATAILNRLGAMAKANGRSAAQHIRVLRGALAAEAERLPAEERLSQHTTGLGTLDLTQGALLAKSWPLQQQIVVAAQAALPDFSIVFQGHRVTIQVVLFRLLSAWHALHAAWTDPTPLSQDQITQYRGCLTDFTQAWEALGWKPTVWVHWVASHSLAHMQQHRGLAFFSSVPVEHRHKGFKRDLANTFLGYKCSRPLFTARGLTHILRLDALTLPLADATLGFHTDRRMKRSRSGR